MPSSSDDFSTLFELLPIGAYRTDAHSRQLRANRAMLAIFGFADEAEMLANARASGRGWYVQPGRRAEFLALLEAQGFVREFVSEMERHGTGERFWISENAHLVRDASGHVLYHEGTIEDVTVRKLAEDALQVTLDNAGRGIVRLDPEGRVVLYNRFFLQLLDLPEPLLAGRPHIEEVIRFQKQRGDFGPSNELLYDKGFSVQSAASIPQMLAGTGSYLRRTLDGRVIEVTTQPLPDGGVVRTYSNVTEYVNVQEALAEKTRSLQITLDSMIQGIHTIDAEGRTTLSNRRHQELLGLPEGMMAARPTMEELVRFQIERGDFGQNFSFVDALARGYVAVGDKLPPLQGPESYLRKTRDGRTLEVRTRPLPGGGAVRTFTDMTDYVQAQEELARKQAQLTALIDNIPDWVWLQDAEGACVFANPAYLRHHGFEGRDIRGQRPRDLFDLERAARYWASDLEAMRSERPLVYEEEIVNPVTGAAEVFELIKVGIRDESGRCVGMLGISRDITTRKRAEGALIAARDAAEAGERAKAEFLANMSHEIRTPMNAVIGMSDLLLDTPLSAAQREFAETIRTSGDQLLGLINDILDFSKIESGHLSLEHEPVNLCDCLESALDLAAQAAASKGLDLLYWIEDDVPRAIYGDATRLRQLFVNLLGNAVKFTERGEVMASLARVEGADGRVWLHAAVRDTGIGIPADRMDRLFQVFSQVDTSTTRRFGGTGLGLAICRRLVTLMGGRIWVESSPGLGSTFHFELPVEPVPAGPQPFLARKPATLAGRRLLIVDDNAANRDILTHQTRRWGMQSQAAASGVEALAWVDAGQPFDAAVLDVQMPGMDGYTLAAQLRKRRGPGELPLLVLTSLGAPRGGTPAGLQVAQSLTKPVKTQALFEALTALFDRPAAAAPWAAAASSAPALAERHPLRMLLAEDNPVNQRVAALILGRIGYAVETAASGQQALTAADQALAEGRPYDVVWMDVQMPDVDGLEATRRLRTALPHAAQPWIVAMTANAMEGDREACLAAGMNDYLSKPIRPAEVTQALERAIAARASQAKA